jgi:hypothetical protein
VVVVAGVTLIEAVVCPPGDHKYVPPPVLGVAVSVAVCPAQMVGELTESVATLFTVTVEVAVEDPQLPVAVTV